jgi:hypothetical protein
MLRGQAIFKEQHSHPAGASQPGGQLAVAAKRPKLVTSAVEKEEHPTGVHPWGHEPISRDPASGYLHHFYIVRHRVKAARGHEGGTPFI